MIYPFCDVFRQQCDDKKQKQANTWCLFICTIVSSGKMIEMKYAKARCHIGFTLSNELMYKNK